MLRIYRLQHGINKGKQGKIRSVIKAYRLDGSINSLEAMEIVF